ncbi:MAG: BRCT domain-containing protein [Candidatus Scalindua sp.]
MTVMFASEQKSILNKSGIKLKILTEEKVSQIAERAIDVDTLSDDQLVEFLEIANAAYRGGVRIISDEDYDHIYIDSLRNRDPKHPFLGAVEPEAAFAGKKVELPVQMLSTKKAYSHQEINKWIKSLQKSARKIDIDDEKLSILITPKLDGFAAYDDGEHLYTRGDGRRGTDVTRVFYRGLVVGGDGERGHGAGEIVVKTEYFEKYLSKYFDNSRNFQAAILAEKKEDVRVQRAIDEKAAIFMPFSQLPSWEGSISELIDNFDNVVAKVWAYVDYDVDGVILEVTDETLKKYLGSTRHHHSWQMAYKKNIEKAEVKILRVVHQTSRSGRVNPVVEIEPTRLSGATIRRVSAHHYKMVKDKGIGPGAVIELVRSGLVIPKIEKVIKPSEPIIPKTCPSCHVGLIWNGDYRCCPNTMECPAQIENTMEHYFKTLGNIDGFGAKTISKLYKNGVRTVWQIYQMKVDNFQQMKCEKEDAETKKIINCFGPVQSKNMRDQLNRSRLDPIEDWRFLASFGVFRMGGGNCEKLLCCYRLLDVFELDESKIAEVEGFAKVTAKAIVTGLKKIRKQFMMLYESGFNLQITPLLSELKEAGVISNISGKKVVFTGAMTSGKRTEMEADARKLGAKVSSSVSKKTHYLVAGENVGQKKIDAAKSKGVTVISEKQYLQLIRRE